MNSVLLGSSIRAFIVGKPGSELLVYNYVLVIDSSFPQVEHS